MSEIKKNLETRRAELKQKLVGLKPLQDELEEVELLLSFYNKTRPNHEDWEHSKRGGWERPGHDNGCRCHECDPSR